MQTPVGNSNGHDTFAFVFSVRRAPCEVVSMYKAQEEDEEDEEEEEEE